MEQQQVDFDYSNYDYSIKILGSESKRILSTLLNPIKVIVTDEGHCRYWIGLAEFIGIQEELILNMKHNSDPTKMLLRTWLDSNNGSATIKHLFLYLEKLDRFDVIEDVQTFIENDIKYYNENVEDKISLCNSQGADFQILTRDDVERAKSKLGPEHYDAFLLHADEDEDFVVEIVNHLEVENHLKLCVKDRDIEAGLLEHEAVLKLIADRCHKLIAIISPAFFENKINKFFCNFGLKIGMEYGQRKFIACLYAPCEIPRELSLYFMLDYQRVSRFCNFWDKLRDCIILDKVQNETQVNKESSVSSKSSDSTKSYNKTSNGVTLNKTKFEWIRKLLPKENTSKESTSATNSEIVEKRDKKKFWKRKSKTKLAIAS